MSDIREPNTYSFIASTDPKVDGRTLRKYATPHLWAFGDLRDLTLGGTPGTGDSGSPNQNPPEVGGRYQDIA
jgi:hypothetical protein